MVKDKNTLTKRYKIRNPILRVSLAAQPHVSSQPQRSSSQPQQQVRVEELDINVETSSAQQYLWYSDSIKKKIAKPHTTYPYVYVLPSRDDVAVVREPFCPVRLSTNSCHVKYIVSKDALYILGWLTSEKNVINVFSHKKFERERAQILSRKKKNKVVSLGNEYEFLEMKKKMREMPAFKHLNPEFHECEFEENYDSMEKVAHREIKDIPLGKTQLLNAIHCLCKSKSPRDDRSRAMIVSIEMLSELVRFRTVREFVSLHYPHGQSPDPHIIELVKNWDTMSENLLEWLRTDEEKSSLITKKEKTKPHEVDEEKSSSVTKKEKTKPHEVEVKVGSTVYKGEDLVGELLVAKNT